jgi:uncharacterized protein (DUF305 family)
MFLASLAGAGVSTMSFSVARAAEGTPEHKAEHCAAPMGTPDTDDHAGHGDMDHGTPMAGMEFDLAYIDMMIPHHESVIALAEIARDQLGDERLQTIADAILETQPPEIEELAALREEWYGSPEPEMMSDELMATSMGMSHGCADQMHMDQMSAEWQVEQFEAADDKDLAFIDQVIPHHEMAVVTSQLALEHANHEEIKDIARMVIDAQEREIKELEAIRAELTGEATPAS